jgi:large subunit ribosomal protein LP0
LKEIRELIVANKVAAPARAGAFAPKDVVVPSIHTKIARGTIEIVSDVKVVTADTRVGHVHLRDDRRPNLRPRKRVLA